MGVCKYKGIGVVDSGGMCGDLGWLIEGGMGEEKG